MCRCHAVAFVPNPIHTTSPNVAVRGAVTFRTVLRNLPRRRTVEAPRPPGGRRRLRLRRNIMRLRLLCTSAAAAASSVASLPVRPLPYRGCLLDLTASTSIITVDAFEERLAPSLERWRTEGIKSCMLKLPIESAALATVAATEGFCFHHVPLDGGGRHVVLKKWLQPHLEDKVPPFATHQVGVAGLCTDGGRLLLVKEWRDTDTGRVPSAQWKLPCVRARAHAPLRHGDTLTDLHHILTVSVTSAADYSTPVSRSPPPPCARPSKRPACGRPSARCSRSGTGTA